MSTLIRRAGALLALLLVSASVQAQTYTHAVYLDRDQDSTTGCDVATAAGTVTGAEARLTATIASYPATVQQLSLAECAGAGFGADTVIDGGHPVGYDLGAAGTDVVELALDLGLLTPGGGEDWTLWFVSTATATGAVDLAGPFAAPGLGTAPAPPPVPQPTVIPTLDPWALLLLSLALGVGVVWAGRRYRGLLPVLLVGAALSITGIAWAANYLLDGNIGDWDVAPLGLDPAGDPTANDPGADLHQVFAAREGRSVFFRADVAEAQIERLITGLLTTAFSSDENPANGTVVGELRNATTGLASLLQFQLDGQVPAAAFAVDGDGTLTVADGTLVDFEAASSHALDVQVSINGVPALTLQVAVTVTVNDLNEAPLIAAQAFAVDESSAAGSEVGTLVASDPDGDTLAYALTGGNTNGAFALDTVTGILTVADAAEIVPANSPFSLAVEASDGSLATGATITVTVNDLNFPPETAAGAGVYATDEDVLLAEAAPGLLAGFTDPDGDALSVVTTPTVAPANGSLVLNADGSFSYTPDADFNGADAFTYTVSDGNGGSVERDVNLTVNPVADAPVAVADGFTLAEGGSLAPTAPGVLANDTDAEGDALTAVLDSGPASASSFTLNADGSFSYTHDGSESASDSFSYHASDGGLDSAVVTVTLTITGENDLPVAVDDAYTVAESATLTVIADGVLGNDTDAEGDALSAALVTGPANASAFILNADGSFDYTHDGSETTSDGFTYTASDASGASNTATVVLTITPVNDAPAGTADGYTLDEGGTLNEAAPGVLGNDTDADGDPLTAVLVAGPISASSFVLNADGSFSYAHDGSEIAADSFSYTANDGSADSATVTVSLTITPTNDAPVAVNDAGSTDEDTALVVAAPGVLGNDSDAEGDTLTAVLDGGPGNAASFTLNADGSYSYTPSPGFNGVDSFTYHANDGAADSTVASVTITVNAVDDPPVATADAYAVDEGATLAEAAPGVLGNDTDPEAGPLTAVLVAGPASASSFSLGADGSFSYTHDGSETTSDSFTYTANDGSGPSNPATVTLTINPVNDAPVATDDGYAVDEGGTLNQAAPGVLGNDSDVEGDGFTAVLVAGPAQASAFTLNSDGSFSYTHDGSENAADSFTYQANDGTASNTATVVIGINPVDDLPVANDDSATVLEDAAATPIGVLANDTDAEGDAFTIVGASDPANGTVVVAGDGTGLTYQPDANYCGADSFSYTITPGSDSATVSVTVTCVDDPPTAVEDAGAVDEDDPATAIGVFANDTDPDAGPISISGASDPANGTVVVAGDGSGLTYQPDANYCNDGVTTDDFTYTLAPGGSTATVAMTVVCINDAPTLANATIAYATAGNTQLHVDGATLAGLASIADAGDALAKSAPSDIDGPGPFTVVPFSGASANGGQVVLAADGSFTYVPPVGFSGTDTAAFQVSDNGAPAAFANGTIQVTVSEVVWYVRDVVDANNPAGGDGRSNNAFETLAGAQAASGANHQIFVYRGNTGTTPLGGGITLKNGQKLHGEGIGLVHPTHGTLVAAGTRPHITNAAGNGVTVLADTANGDRTGIEIRGLQVSGSTNAIDATSANAANLGLRISENTISGAGSEGIDVNVGSTNANQTLAVFDNGLSATGTALAIDRTAGTLTITAFDDNLVSGDTGGSGISVSGAVFDATPGGTFDTVNTGTTAVGSSGNAVGAAGIVLTNASGDISLPGIGVYAGTGAALSASGTTAYTGSAGLRITAANGTEVFSSSAGPALDIGTATISLAPTLVRSTGSATYGVNLSAVAGTLTAGLASQISGTGPAATAYRVAGGSVSTTWNGTISASQGAGVAVSGNSGAHAFSGALSLTTGSAHAVHLDSNAGASFSFSGGMALSTTSGNGLHAVGSGTLAVTGTNTVASGTGTAINVRNTTIHGSGITFRSVAASGGANGIVLVSTGSLGGLTVTGDGSNTAVGGNGSGGTLSGMVGGDGTIAGSAIYMDDTRSVVLRRMTINGTNQNFGIRGFRVNNFTLEYATVSGTHGTSASFDNYGEGAIYFGDDASTATNGLTGTGTFTNLVVSGGRSRNLSIVNTAGTLNRATVTGSSFGLNQSFSDAGTSLAFEARNAGTVLNATVTNSTFTGAPGDLTNFTGQTATTMDVVYTGNDLSNAHAHNIAGGGGLTVASQGVMTFLVQDNDMRDADGSAITLFKADLGTSMRGTVNSNRIGVAGVPESGSKSGNGIFIVLAGGGQGVYAITNNVIRNYDGNAAIYADNTGGSYDLDLTLTGNTAAEPGAGSFTGVAVTAGAPTSADDIDVCAHISGNDFSASGGAAPDIYLGVSTAASSMRLPGYGGSTAAAVESFIQMASINPASTLVDAYTDAPAVESQFTGGAACLTP